jgi:hypothetical protein
MDDRPKLCFGSFPLGFGPNPPVFLWFRSLFCPPVEIVFGKKAFGLCFSIGVLFLPPSVFWVALCYLPPCLCRVFLPLFMLGSSFLLVASFSLAFIKPENVVIKVSHVRPCVPRSAVTDLLPKRSWATKKVEHLIQKRRRSQLEMATFILDLEFWKVL